ncbi:hypothetical protein GUJ93_ZPchr0003g16622 [Zizania palustris]|uniref:Protein kinase domain-containing protein n=1 Tax=Zizania palustris TaxID=103762 RepID=A0A8J5S839_ZIZPA|nr:hypothetical protein GUJ93_ZPchr0003g16622 [Zizania palustris]
MMRAGGGLWALLLLVALVAAAPGVVVGQANLTSPADLSALYALRGSLGLRARDWPRRVDPCSAWVGVGCRGGRVVSVSLVGLRRTRLGRLAPRFAVDGLRNFTRLEAFRAAGFGLPGSIPVWLGSGLAPTFQLLDISDCAVTGEIPASAIAGLSNLTTLNLAGNLLSGQLPAAALPGLARLRILNLSGNAFSGALPEAVWSLPELSVLDVSRANLTGSLPVTGLALPSNVQMMDLSGNLFYGGVPLSFSQLFGRTVLANISGNYFDGKLGVSNGGGGNFSFELNCFADVAGQRSQAECQQFYAGRGLPYDGPVSAPTPQPALPVSPGRNKSHRNLKYILIGAIGGGVLLVAVIAVILYCFVCSGSRSRNDQRESGARNTPSVVSGIGGGAVSGGSQPSASPANLAKVGDSFGYDQLINATSTFGEERLIKHGHSGDLYLGVLHEGTYVVVKRITSRVARKDAYLTELDLFAKGLHERLVPIMGHCLDKEEEKLLVYRFVRNGDLSSALHRKSGEEEEGMQSLDWIKRLKIATGVAEALCYLHHECTPPMVHRDVQASSILLDDKFEVRLGSLSEVCPQEGEGHQNVITKLLRFSSTADQGSSGLPSASCSYDVYCFGKVLLELVTGRLGISASNEAATSDWLDNTLRYVNIYEKELMSKIIDPSLIIDEDHLEEVWAMAIVAKSCLNPRSSKRPPMKYILKALENPLKVVREDNGSSSAQLRTSSRGSWNGAFFGSWRHSSSDVGPSRDDNMFKRSETIKSSGGSNGDHSSSRRRQSKEIFPEPSGSRDTDD